MTLLVHKQTITFTNSLQEFTVMAKAGPQQAPDWIRDTESYRAAVKSGFIAEINVVTPAVQIEEPSKDLGDLAEIGLLSGGTPTKTKTTK